MKSNKLFLFFFLAGLACLTFAGLNLFISLNPSLLKPKVQYEIGFVKDIKRVASRKLKYSQSERAKTGDKVYSKETYSLRDKASLSMVLSGEEITIIGPAKFSLQVISPESKRVFINFSEFNSVKASSELKNITLTYKGWVIESYFSKEDLIKTVNQEITSLTVSDEDLDDSADGERKDGNNNESMLDELIAAKRPLLKRCYENYLRKNPMATGKLVVEFQLQNTGKVSASRIKDSSFFKDESFKSCIQDVFLRIKTSPFEVDGGHLTVTYPIEFE